MKQLISTAKIISLASVALALLLAPACATSHHRPAKKLAGAKSLEPFDAIIVPGVPFKNEGWDSIMKARVLWSYILYKDGYTKNVIYSGSSVYSPYYEGRIMALYGEKLGIPRSHIFSETSANHSTENVYYSYLLAKKEGFKTIALATDPFQSLMLRKFTRKRFATQIYHLPFVSDSLKVYNYLNPDIDPSSARADNFVSITKKKSFFKRFKGTMGGDIDWGQYKDGKVGPL